jgi:cytochrome c2
MKRRSIRCTPTPVAGLAMATLFMWAGPSLAEDRYPEQPWGYGTVAERCTVCHSLEEGGVFRVAPNLWNIVGDEKARARSWYNYSPELIRMGGTWTNEDLDSFLADANAFAPGSTKSIRVTDPEERQQIIEFLDGLHD